MSGGWEEEANRIGAANPRHVLLRAADAPRGAEALSKLVRMRDSDGVDSALT